MERFEEGQFIDQSEPKNDARLVQVEGHDQLAGLCQSEQRPLLGEPDPATPWIPGRRNNDDLSHGRRRRLDHRRTAGRLSCRTGSTTIVQLCGDAAAPRSPTTCQWYAKLCVISTLLDKRAFAVSPKRTFLGHTFRASERSKSDHLLCRINMSRNVMSRKRYMDA